MKINTPKLTYLLGLFFLMHSSVLIAQNRSIEALETDLEQTDNDSIKIRLLQQLTFKTINQDVEKSIVYIKKGIQLSQKKLNYKNLAGFHLEYSRYLSSTNTIDSAIVIIKKAASYLSNVSSLRVHLSVSTQYAKLLQQKGDLSGATKKYIEALEIAEKEQLKEAMAACYIGLNSLLQSQKMYTEAIQYIRKCAGICDDLRPHRISYCKSIVYGNLANFYFKQQQFDSTLYYGLKAIQSKEKIQNLRDLHLSYNIVANAYMKKKDTSNAIQFYNKSLRTTTKMKDIPGTGETLSLMGKIYLKRKNIKALDTIIAQLDSIMPKVQVPHAWINYLQLKRNYFELKENYKDALASLKDQFNMVDSIRKKKNAALIASLETQYETNKYKLEKELTEKQLLLSNERVFQNKRNFIGVAFFSLLITLLLLYILSRLKIIRQQKIALDKAYEQLEIQKQNEVALLNLKALQAQMNPHFMFNALNSIQDLVLMKDIKNSTIYLGKFSALIRKILLSSKQQFIPLDKELEILKLYLDLEKLRFGDQLTITFDCQISAEQQPNIYLPAMFIQPYIENAIKHGLFHKVGTKKLLVEFSIRKHFLVCIIEDNGIGQAKANEIKEKMAHLHTGFSTEAIQHRVQFLNQTLNKDIQIQTQDLIEQELPIGTRVILHFPISE